MVMRSLQTTGEVRLDGAKRNILGRSARLWPAPTPVRSDSAASVQACRLCQIVTKSGCKRGLSGECWLTSQADPSWGADQSVST